MPRQDEVIAALQGGADPDELSDPSGMSAVSPNNLGIDAALLSHMSSFRYENDRRRPPGVIMFRYGNGEVVFVDNFSNLHYAHRRTVRRALRDNGGMNSYKYFDRSLSFDQNSGVIHDGREVNGNEPYVLNPTEFEN